MPFNLHRFRDDALVAEGPRAARRTLAGVVVACSVVLTPGVQGQSCVGDRNQEAAINRGYLELLVGDRGGCQAMIDSVTPTEGGILGGTLLAITGANLGGTNQVQVGGVPGTRLLAVVPTMVTAITPPGPADPVSVTVTVETAETTHPYLGVAAEG